MNLEIIDGYKEVVEYIGNITSFHDDYIKSIDISDGNIILFIMLSDEEKKKKVKITFSDVVEFVLQGSLPSSIVSIILDFEIVKEENSIIVNVSTSYGTECQIVSNRIKMELVD